jgi:hypothetical protein
VSASSSNHGEISICVWNKKIKAESARETANEPDGVPILSRLIAYSVLLGVAFLVYQWFIKVRLLLQFRAGSLIANMMDSGMAHVAELCR